MLHDVKPNRMSPSNLIGLLWKGAPRRIEIKMPRSEERNVSVVAFLTPKAKGSPEGPGILKVIQTTAVI